MESRYKKIILLFLLFITLKAYETGDIILRKEANILSDLFSQIDPCGYSHSGIIIKTGNGIYVAHIEYDKDNFLKLEPVDKFLKYAEKYRVLKPNFKFSKTALKKIIYSLKKKNIKFDTEFKLTNNSFYCTELLDYVYFKLIHKHIYSYLYNFKGMKIITIKSILNSKLFN